MVHIWWKRPLLDILVFTLFMVSPEFLPGTIAVFAFSGFPVFIILLSRLSADSFLLRPLRRWACHIWDFTRVRIPIFPALNLPSSNNWCQADPPPCIIHRQSYSRVPLCARPNPYPLCITWCWPQISGGSSWKSSCVRKHSYTSHGPHHNCETIFWSSWYLLAVQNSSIGDLVTNSMTNWLTH